MSALLTLVPSFTVMMDDTLGNSRRIDESFYCIGTIELRRRKVGVVLNSGVDRSSGSAELFVNISLIIDSS